MVWDTGSNQRPRPQYEQRQYNNRRYDYRNRDYEPYELDRRQVQNQMYSRQNQGLGRLQYGHNGPRNDQQFGRNGPQYYNRRNGPQNNNNDYVNMERDVEQIKQPAKETMIDDVFESDNQEGDTVHTDIDDETLEKKIVTNKDDSPKSKRKDANEEMELPEEQDLEDMPQLERYKSMEYQSQPDLETITSPLHINAGVRASVEDDDISPTSSLRKHKKKGMGKYPKSRRGEREPDPSAMPPETFEPIFSGAPISGLNYPGSFNEPPPAYPGGFVPYGLIPAMHFAPTAPGAQTYAYAYQTAPTPTGGPPATQGAYMVQNVPTTDGNRRTAFVVEQTLSPDKIKATSSPKYRRRKNSDPFRKNENRLSGGSKHNRGGKDQDLDIIARGAAPPDPGQGHRSVAMKSGTDPDTGIQSTQV